MYNIDLVALYALRDELHKEAAGLMGMLANPRLHSALGGAGAMGGVGAAGGAILGAGVEGVRNYRNARSEGAGVGGSFGAGVAGALGGARKGAVIGGAAGLAAGGIGGAAAPGRMDAARQALTTTGAGVGSAARFGQRQVHALTGWRPGTDPSSIRSIGAGAHNAQEALGTAVEARNAARAAMESGKRQDPSLLQKLKGVTTPQPIATQGDVSKAVKAVDTARAGYGAAFRAEQMGLTSIPGYAKSMKDNGVLPTMSAGFKEQWHGMSPGWKAVMIGAPLAETAHAIHTPDQEGGPGKGERVARGLAGAVAGSTMGSIPMATGSLLQHGITGAAGAAGRAVDRFRKSRPSFDPSADASAGQVVPAERHMSNHAAGMRNDVTGGLG